MATRTAAARFVGFVCASCRATARSKLPSSAAPIAYSNSSRLFHITASYQKKQKGREKDKPLSQEKEPQSDSKADPYDLDALKESVTKIQTKLKDSLAKLKPGGILNPQLVENLRIQPQKGSKETTRLGDVAVCVPRGRLLMIIAGDKEHVKPISTAIFTSGLNLNPEKDPENPLQLNIKMATPTAETRQSTIQEAATIGETAKQAVTQAGRTQRKKLHDMKNLVRPDDFHKAEQIMDKFVADANTETKRIVDSARKTLESR